MGYVHSSSLVWYKFWIFGLVWGNGFRVPVAHPQPKIPRVPQASTVVVVVVVTTSTLQVLDLT